MELNPLATIAENLRTQNNRITANPVFMIEQSKRVYGLGPDWTDKFVWMNDEGEEAGSELAEAFEAKNREDGTDEIEDYHRVGYMEYWLPIQPFFTEAAAQDYMRRNGHNLKTTRIFVHGGYRNEEWRTIRDHLITFASEERAATYTLRATD